MSSALGVNDVVGSGEGSRGPKMIQTSIRAWQTALAALILCSCAVFTNAAQVTLAWDSPTNNVDRTRLTDLAGSRLYYGTASGSYTNFVDVGRMNTATVSNLTDGTTYYFAATAYNHLGEESDFCSELVWTAASVAHDYIWFEAEDGLLTDPIVTRSDSTASGGLYANATRSEQGTAKFSFTASGGNYIVWAYAAASAPNPSGHDSFYVSVDGKNEDVWDLFYDHHDGPATNWTWDVVSVRDGGSFDENLLDPAVFNLTPGTHTLQLRSRESGAKLDRILITTDMSYSPGESGGNSDADGDGQPDAWELWRFGGIADAHGAPDGDSDHDGVCNADEFTAGTDPLDASSHLALDINVSDGQLEVSFPARAAEGIGYDGYQRRMSLESTTAPLGGANQWMLLPGHTDIVAANQTVKYAQALSDSAPATFYRVRARLVK